MTREVLLRRRHVLQAAGLGALGAATLTACAPGEGTAPPDEGKTTIRFMGLFFIEDELAAAQRIVEEFNAQSSTVHVEYVQDSWSTIESKMSVGFSSGDVPDVVHYYDAGLVPWGENGLLTDVTEIISADTLAALNSGPMNSLTSPDFGLLGVPFETETPLIYYNVDLLATAGVEPATRDNPWTWEDLARNARRIADAHPGVAGVSASWRASEVFFKLGLAWQAGSEPIVVDDGLYSVRADDAGTSRAINFVRELFDEGLADEAGLEGDAVASFVSGNSAMLILGAWARTYLPTMEGVDGIEWAAMPFLAGEVDNLGSGAAQALAVPASSANQEAAAEFIEYWSQPENLAGICLAAGQLPPSTRAVELIAEEVGDDDYWPDALAAADLLNGQPYCPGWVPMLGKVWDPAMFSYFRAQSTFDDMAQIIGEDGTTEVRLASGRG